MAEIVLTDPHFTIGGNDVSSYFTSLTLEPSADLQESTAFGDSWRTRLGGLKDWSLSADFNQDFDAGALDAILFPLTGSISMMGNGALTRATS